MKTIIEVVAAPAGSDDRYQFFKDDTGQMWKATVDLKVARRPMLSKADVEAAPSELAVSVVVSPVDSKGKVLRENDMPIIIDTHTHTFTNAEMAAEDFDPTERIMRVVAERITIGQSRLTGLDKINTLVNDWNGKAKLKAGKFEYEAEPEGRVLPGVVEVFGQTAVRAVEGSPDSGPPAPEPA